MATLNKIGAPGVGSGILQPALQHRWRLVVSSSNIQLPIISMQVINSNINYVGQSFYMEIDQPITCELQKEISALIKNHDNTFRVDILDSYDNVMHSLEFIYVRIINHNMELNYATADIIRHQLSCEFDHYNVLTPDMIKKEDVQVSSEERYIHAMKVVK